MWREFLGETFSSTDPPETKQIIGKADRGDPSKNVFEYTSSSSLQKKPLDYPGAFEFSSTGHPGRRQVIGKANRGDPSNKLASETRRIKLSYIHNP